MRLVVAPVEGLEAMRASTLLARTNKSLSSSRSSPRTSRMAGGILRRNISLKTILFLCSFAGSSRNIFAAMMAADPLPPWGGNRGSWTRAACPTVQRSPWPAWWNGHRYPGVGVLPIVGPPRTLESPSSSGLWRTQTASPDPWLSGCTSWTDFRGVRSRGQGFCLKTRGSWGTRDWPIAGPKTGWTVHYWIEVERRPSPWCRFGAETMRLLKWTSGCCEDVVVKTLSSRRCREDIVEKTFPWRSCREWKFSWLFERLAADLRSF